MTRASISPRIPLLAAALAGLLAVFLMADGAPPAHAAAPAQQPWIHSEVPAHLGFQVYWWDVKTTADRDTSVTGYDVQYRARGATTWISKAHSGTQRAAEFSGLNAGTRYEVRVRATNSDGNSVWSLIHETSAVRSYATTANAPFPVEVEAGDAQARVTWGQPSHTGGHTLLGYVVRLYSPIDTLLRRIEVSGISTTSQLITGLTNGREYFVDVFAKGGEEFRDEDSLASLGASFTPSGPMTSQSSDATLRALSVSAGSISPAFSSTTYAYTVSVASGVTSTTVTPTVNHSAATVTVNGTVVASGSPSGAIALAVGDNVITVRVTAENGDTQDYTVTITRQSANANLSALSASSATSESATYSRQTLAPAFDVGTTAYTVRVDFDLTHAKVTPTVADTDATVRVGKRGATLATVASGADSGPIALAVGDNEIVVRVTAEDPSITRDYTVTITRQPRNAGDGAPSAPSGLTVTPGRHSLSVFWTAPGQSVQGYDVHYTSMSADDLADDAAIGAYVHPSGRYSLPENPYPYLGWVRLAHGYLAELKYGVGYLQPGQQYRFRVRAYDRFGTGPWAVGSGVPWQAARTVSLSATPERVREGDEVTITATVRYNGRPSPIQEDMDVLVRVHLGTAEAGDVGTLERISIGKYTDRASVTIQTNRDSDGDDEKFAVLIHSIPARSLARAGDPDIVWVTITEGDPAPPEPVVTSPTATMTISGQGQSPTVSGSQDDPPEQQAAPQPASVTLSLDAATVSESAGAVTVTATLDAPATQGGIGGFLTAGAAGTATADVDFTMPLSIFIPDGQRSAAATISITDDDIDEADETVVISALFDVGTALLEDTVTLTITDDDTAATASVSVTDTTSRDPQQDPPGLPPIAARYDTNGDGAIDGTEYQQVKNDWLTAKITYAQFLEVVKIHLKSG